MASVNASGSSALDLNSRAMTVDGVTYTSYAENPPSTTMRSVLQDVWDDDAEVWVQQWVLVPVPDTTHAKLWTYGWGSNVLSADGTHTVTARIRDAAGQAATDTWSFSVRIPPTFGTPQPADGSIVTTTTPAITIPVTDNSVVATWTVLVNGTPASAVYDNTAKVLRVTLASPLPRDGRTVVSATVADGVGDSVSLSWGFTVQVLPDMTAVTNCPSCHPGYETDNDMGPICKDCHYGTPTYHNGAPETLHTPANLDSACKLCHVSSLTNEHAGRTTEAGQPITCLTCHTSTDPLVQGAITSGASGCVSCHTLSGAGHYSIHDSTIASAPLGVTGAVCSDCHASANLIDVHADVTASTGATSCAVCHPSPRNTITGDWNNTCVQGGCHAVGSATEMHGRTSTTHAVLSANSACFVSGCHTGTDVSVIHANAHVVVGGVTKSGCSACHTTSGAPTKNCIDCHPEKVASHYDPVLHTGSAAPATITIGGTSYGPLACTSCHSLELGVEHSKPTSSSASKGCGACHPSPKNTLTPSWNHATCVQGGCHTLSSSAPMHGSIDASHALPTPAPSCTISTCHGASGNIAAIHANATTTTAGVTVSGCLVCHSASKVPSSSQCSSCHDAATAHAPAKNIHAVPNFSGNIQIIDGTHVLEIWSMDCSTCHNGANLMTIHNNDCSLCHQPGGPRSTFTTWNKTCQQGACHPTYHTQLVSGHQGVLAAGCDCHNQGDWSVDCATCHTTYPTVNSVPPVTTSDAKSAYAGTATITLTPTSASPIAATYYSLDGAAASTGTVIVVPMPAADIATHTLAFRSIDINGMSETTKTVTFTISTRDVTPPVTTSNAVASYTGTATISLTATDGPGGSGVAGTRYSLDGSAWTTGTVVTAGWRPPPTSSHTLSFLSVDKAGNREATKTVTFTTNAPPDTTPPVTTTNAQANYASTATITLSATDSGWGVAGTRYLLDSGAWTTGTVVVVPSAAVGSHTLKYRSVDLAGNVEATKSVSFTITAPLATLNFEWWPSDYGDAQVHIEDSSGHVVARGEMSGNGYMNWSYQVPSGQKYWMYVDYIYDAASGVEDGGYGIWTPTLTPGQTYNWQFW